MDLPTQDKQDIVRVVYGTHEEVLRHLQFHTRMLYEYHEKIDDMWHAAMEQIQEKHDRMVALTE